jgi:hypothetical protein
MNSEYIKLAAAALVAAIAGSQTVHMIYQPMAVSLFLDLRVVVFFFLGPEKN